MAMRVPWKVKESQEIAAAKIEEVMARIRIIIVPLRPDQPQTEYLV
jgi:hypothetical protein